LLILDRIERLNEKRFTNGIASIVDLG